MAGIQIEQVTPPVGPPAPSGGSGGTFARIKGWWNRLPTWGKVVVVLIAIVLVVLIWLFIGGIAGSSNGGGSSTSSNPGPSGGGGDGGGGGSTPITWPNLPGNISDPGPITPTPGNEPTPTTTPTTTPTITPTPAKSTHTVHRTTAIVTPVQHTEPTTYTQPAHSETSYPKPTVAQPAYAHQTYAHPKSPFANQQHATAKGYASHPASERVKYGERPQDAAQVRPGLAPQVRAIRPMNAHAVPAKAKKSAPPQARPYTTYDRATPYHVKESKPAKAPKTTKSAPTRLGQAGLREF